MRGIIRVLLRLLPGLVILLINICDALLFGTPPLIASHLHNPGMTTTTQYLTQLFGVASTRKTLVRGSRALSLGSCALAIGYRLDIYPRFGSRTELMRRLHKKTTKHCGMLSRVVAVFCAIDARLSKVSGLRDGT